MKAILTALLTLSPQTRRHLMFLFVGLALFGLVIALISPPGNIGIHNLDKLMHLSALFGFAFLLNLATRRPFWYWQAPLLLAYSALIEILQAFTPWRSFSVADWAADALGILLYWLVWRVLLKYAHLEATV